MNQKGAVSEQRAAWIIGKLVTGETIVIASDGTELARSVGYDPRTGDQLRFIIDCANEGWRARNDRADRLRAEREEARGIYRVAIEYARMALRHVEDARSALDMTIGLAERGDES